jgi:hypothetical protein
MDLLRRAMSETRTEHYANPFGMPSPGNVEKLGAGKKDTRPRLTAQHILRRGDASGLGENGCVHALLLQPGE